jgi:hypothetical protein
MLRTCLPAVFPVTQIRRAMPASDAPSAIGTGTSRPAATGHRADHANASREHGLLRRPDRLARRHTTPRIQARGSAGTQTSVGDADGEPRGATAPDQLGDLMPVDVVSVNLGQRPGDAEPLEL